MNWDEVQLKAIPQDQRMSQDSHPVVENGKSSSRDLLGFVVSLRVEGEGISLNQYTIGLCACSNASPRTIKSQGEVMR